MKRTFFVLVLIALFATAGFAWDQTDLELALETENPTAAQKQLLEEYFASQDYQNQNAILNAGGPDAAGYMFKDSEEVDGPTYNWYDISATGTSIQGDMGDDTTTGPYPIGFSFPYYGTTFTDFYVGSNGAINFDGEYISLSNYQMPSTSEDGHIAIFHDDMDPADATDAETLYEVVNDGTQDILIISLLNWDEYSGNTDPTLQESITAQYQLFADGTIQLMYQTVEAGIDITSCTIGIQNPTRDVGLSVLYNGSIADYPYDNLAIMFEQLAPDASLEGTVTDLDTGDPIEGAMVTYGAMETTTDASGFYTFADLYSGTTETLAVSAFNYFGYSADVTLGVGVNVEDVALEMMPIPDYFTSFEDDQGPFADDGDGEWEWGMQTNPDVIDHGGPDAAYQGTNVWATQLDTNHTDTGGDRWLYSNMSWELGVGASVQYYHWFDYNDNFDGYNFKISVDGGTTWETLQPDMGYSGFCSYTGFTDEEVFYNDEVPPTPGQMEWALVTYDLSAYEGETVMFAFHHIASTVVSYYGVAIDDFGIFFGSPPPPAGVDLTITDGDTVSSDGGIVTFDLYVENNTGQIRRGDLWLSATLPNGSNYNIWNYRYTFLPGFAMGEDMTVEVPAFAPSGDYMLNANIGVFPNNAIFVDSEPFTKEAAATVASFTGDPQLRGSRPDLHGTAIAGEAKTDVSALPEEFELGQAYPNPFNPTANFTVSLPDAADLTVRVFNVMGQQVAEVVNARTAAGMHTFTIDGSALSSGIYFIQAQVPGELNAIQKVTLMK